MPKEKKLASCSGRRSMRQPMTPSTHSLNPRVVERYLDAMTLQHAPISSGQMISRGTVSRAGIPSTPPVTYSAPAALQVAERAACSAAWVPIGNPG
jgi:hypothetical protein